MYTTLSWSALLAAALLIRKLRHSASISKWNAVSLAVLAFFLSAVLSAVCSPYRDSVLRGAGRYDGLATLLTYGLIFWGISSAGRLKPQHIYALALAQCLCCLVAVLQLWGYNPLRLFPNNLCYYDAHIAYTGEFLGTIGNTNLLSGFFSLTIPLFCVCYITDAFPGARWLLIPAGLGIAVLAVSGVAGGMVALMGCAFLSAPILLTTRSRMVRALRTASVLCACLSLAFAFQADSSSGTVSCGFKLCIPSLLWLAGAAAAWIFSEICAGIHHFPSPKRMTCFLLTLDGVLLLAALGVLWFWPGTTGTIYEFHSILHGHVEDRFGSSRIQIWRGVLALVPESPLLGGGPDTLALRLDIQFSRYVPETGKTLRTYVDNAHNEYLGYLANLGILGLGAYLTSICISLWKWLQRLADSPYLPALGCALLCYWIQGFFGLGMCIAAPFMWLLWGFFISEQKILHKQ